MGEKEVEERRGRDTNEGRKEGDSNVLPSYTCCTILVSMLCVSNDRKILFTDSSPR